MDHIDTGYSLEQHIEGEPRHLDAPVLRLELTAEAQELHRDEVLRANGHVAKTLVKYPGVRVVLMAFQAGARMGEHRGPGQMVLQTLSGRVRLRVGRGAVDCPKGCLVTLAPSEPHDVEALEDSTVLLTLSWHGRK